MFQKFDSNNPAAPAHVTPVPSDKPPLAVPPKTLKAMAPLRLPSPQAAPKTGQGRGVNKSKAGCLTCKYRKKKCDETKPVCRDCLRFKKNCVWVDYRTMGAEEIRRLRRSVQQQESSHKLRQRSKHAALGLDADAKRAEKAQPSDSQSSADMSGTPANGASVSLAHLDYQAKLEQAALFMKAPHDAPPVKLEGFHNGSQVGSHIVNGAQALIQTTPRTPSGLTLPPRFDFLDPLTTELYPFQQDSHARKTASPPSLDGQLEAVEQQPGLPLAFLNFLRELSLVNWEKSGLNGLEKTGQVEEIGEDDLKLSPKFNIPNFLEQIHSLGEALPIPYTDIATSFNAAFMASPKPSLSVLPELDQKGFYLYNYYLDFLLRKVSIAPGSQDESNSYQKVFLPLAQRDQGVLYGLLAWAGFHLGGSWKTEGARYAELAVKHIRENIDFDGMACSQDRRSVVYKLAALLILCGAEICRGDVKLWSVYLKWGWKLLRDNGGILNFNTNKEEHWLILNFAYHDLLASSTSDRGTYFPNKTYDRIFLDPEGISKGNLNPLVGVSQKLYRLIGDISKLSYESKQIILGYYRRPPRNNKPFSPESAVSPTSVSDTDTDVSEHNKTAILLSSIMTKAQHLENCIDTAKPDTADLINLLDEELELQLTTFEAFQLSCKLYLRQAILKMNPSALECQILVNDLIKCIDILIESPMQATLVFPFFIAGLFTVTEPAREIMRNRFETMIRIYGPWNVVRVKYLVEQVWLADPAGDRVVDWNSILNDLGWEINFA